MTNMLIKYYSVLRDVSKLETCLDGLLERLNDGSIKVIALKLFHMKIEIDFVRGYPNRL
jgi:hypothetical protein